MRKLTPGARVTFSTVAPNVLAPASQRRAPVRPATLVRPYPGGRFDTGDMWVIEVNGREAVGPVSESMMQELTS